MHQRQCLNEGRVRSKDNRPTSAKRGYDHKWRKYRKVFLGMNPLCVLCQRRGEISGASVVDHIIPHKGDKELFYDEGNHQALCVRCHNAKSAKEK